MRTVLQPPPHANGSHFGRRCVRDVPAQLFNLIRWTMHQTRVWIIAVVAALTASACSAELSGNVDLNGETLAFESCHNGVIYGFRGVELTATSGMRLRIGALPTGAAGVIVMPKDAATGTDLGVECGPFTITDQNSEINKVKNVEGKATLACEAKGFKLSGSVTFGNCH